MEILERSKAMVAGVKKYFTGNPCKNGQLAERNTASGNCCCFLCREERSAKQKKYVSENPDKKKQSDLNYKARNPDKINAMNKAYYKKNKRKILKRCADWKKSNKERVKLLDSSYRDRNRERERQRLKVYSENNPEKIRASSGRYRSANLEKYRFYEASRRARKANATPAWFGELDEMVLSEAFSLCVQREKETGIKWHVDHLIPIQARMACGLHYSDNVQVIPAAVNCLKSNQLIFCEPFSWIS